MTRQSRGLGRQGNIEDFRLTPNEAEQVGCNYNQQDDKFIDLDSTRYNKYRGYNTMPHPTNGQLS